MFLAVAIWESLQPKSELSSPAERRWVNHGVMLAIVATVSTMVLRVGPVVLALAVTNRRWGILNQPWLPLMLRCGLAVVLIDLLQYWVHWSLHHVSWLWRIHQVHHSDPDYDVSTAARFHPLEVLYAQGIRFGAIALLAPPAAGVLIAELLSVVLNLTAHANASLPVWMERTLRFGFVTPDLHRIHHAEEMQDQNQNLGQTFLWWDRIFGTHAGAHSLKEETFRTGLTGLEGFDRLGIGFMLAEPFQNTRRETLEANPESLAE